MEKLAGSSMGVNPEDKAISLYSVAILQPPIYLTFTEAKKMLL
jgi:hypothetical protein